MYPPIGITGYVAITFSQYAVTVAATNLYVYTLVDQTFVSMYSLCQTTSITSGTWINLYLVDTFAQSHIEMVAIGEAMSLFYMIYNDTPSLYMCGNL